MKRVLTVFGTRPEAIKLAPLVKLLDSQLDIESRVCVTAQHRELLDQVLSVFDIQPDFDLDLMQSNQGLAEIAAAALRGIDRVLDVFKPDLVIVQGDTISTLAASQAAFFRQISVFHVEAGLRSGELASPWPEEANRKMVSVVASRHFVATAAAGKNLLKEGVPPELIVETGNTVIDALQYTQKLIAANPNIKEQIKREIGIPKDHREYILVTAHRRENWGQELDNITNAIAQIATDFPNIDFVFPVHPNLRVYNPVHQRLAAINNVKLFSPVSYIEFVCLMSHAKLVLSDSGGIQEEAPSLGIPVLLMRNHTERPEALEANAMRLVGTTTLSIYDAVKELLTNEEVYKGMAQVRNVFGDGLASSRIVYSIRRFLMLPETELVAHE